MCIVKSTITLFVALLYIRRKENVSSHIKPLSDQLAVVIEQFFCQDHWRIGLVSFGRGGGGGGLRTLARIVSSAFARK